MNDYRLHFKHKETQKWLNVDVYEKENKVVASVRGRYPEDFEVTTDFYDRGDPSVFGDTLKQFSFDFVPEESSSREGLFQHYNEEKGRADLFFGIPTFTYIRPFQGFNVDAFIKSVEESGAVRER